MEILVKLRNYDFRQNHILIMNPTLFYGYLKKEKNGLDQKATMPFLRNEFLRTF